MTVRKNANLSERKQGKRYTLLMKKARKKFMRGLKRFYSNMDTNGVSPKRMVMAHVKIIIEKHEAKYANKMNK